MNRERANEIMKAYGSPAFNVGNSVVSFSRQNEENITEIEAFTDEQLQTEWKSLVYMNDILGHVSLNELQRIDLIELEMDGRETIDHDTLTAWYEEERIKYDAQDFGQ